MGDSRYDLKIKFSIYLDTFELDSSCNYYPDSDGVDEGIKQWFAEKYEMARMKWEEHIHKEQIEEEKIRAQKQKKALYLELKKEFEGEDK